MLQYEKITDETETGKILYSKFTSWFRSGYVRCRGVCLPEYYTTFGDEILNMEVRDDDVWVCSFPKTGTTWTQEMVWCIVNDLDYEKAKTNLPNRFPYLEWTSLFDYRNSTLKDIPVIRKDNVNVIKNQSDQRFIKSHLPFQLLPKQIQNGSTKAKIIYVTRNPRDTCVSYYHHCQRGEGYTGNFEEFSQLFLADMVCFAPYWEHVADFYDVSKTNDNILFLTYENMKKDLGSVIDKVCSHLSKKYSAEEIEKLKHHLSFENMKTNPATNYEEYLEVKKRNKETDENCTIKFMRKGQVGDWKNFMTTELSEKFDQRTKVKLSGREIVF